MLYSLSPREVEILEALALARPVVASNVGGIPEMIDEGVTGLLVPPRDADALARAITRLLVDHPYADMLARQGHEVTGVEKGTHPRFALGESSTPLANLTLERLAARYDLPDLHHLAAYGRWLRHLPGLRRGLKRGFTFYRHEPGRPFANGPDNEARALIAASPEDALADSHWLRSDVDQHFAREARAEGVEIHERWELISAHREKGRWRLWARRLGESGELEGEAELEADVVIDATGPAGFLPRALDLADATDRLRTRSGLVYGHFEGLRRFEEVAEEAGAALSPGPYPDDAAAVHHLLDEGWMYVLRFDPMAESGAEGRSEREIVSAGILFERGLPAVSPEELWRQVRDRYPSLAAQFAGARPLFPLRSQPRIQYRRARAVGEGWALLPHTFAFVDPLFSTGIAWTLLGVERLARCFEEASGDLPDASALARYGGRLDAEADRIDRLIALAYRARASFRLLVAVGFLYFAAVSFAESRRRLVDGGDDPWEGFLGVGDPVFDRLFEEAPKRLEAVLDAVSRGAEGEGAVDDFESWIRDGIAERNVAGLADPRRRNLYPVDLELLVQRAPLLGLTPRQVRARLHRLRSGG